MERKEKRGRSIPANPPTIKWFLIETFPARNWILKQAQETWWDYRIKHQKY
ncbi:MAG: hypothetical protein ABSF13_05290 [Smithella sp.]